MQFSSYWSKTQRSVFARRRVKQEKVSATFCNAFAMCAKAIDVWSVAGRIRTELDGESDVAAV